MVCTHATMNKKAACRIATETGDAIQAAQTTSMHSGPNDDDHVHPEHMMTSASTATGYSAAVSDTGLVEDEPDWAALTQANAGFPSVQPNNNMANGWHVRFMQVKARGRMQMQVESHVLDVQQLLKHGVTVLVACSVYCGNVFKDVVRQEHSLPLQQDFIMPLSRSSSTVSGIGLHARFQALHPGIHTTRPECSWITSKAMLHQSAKRKDSYSLRMSTFLRGSTISFVF